MADKRISEFLDGGLVQTGDELAAVRGGVNTKVFAGSAAALDAGLGVGDLIQLEDDGSGTVMLPAVSGANLTDLPFTADPTVQVSADDTTSGYLEDKITGSASITVTKEIDSAGVETLRLDAVGAGGVVEIADGGTGATTAAGARTNLGLGSAATQDVGTAAGNVVQLDGNAKIPQSVLPAPFRSTGTVLVNGGGVLGPFAHGLGKVPDRVWLELVCVTAEHGYSVGDILEVPYDVNTSNTRTAWKNNTQCGIGYVGGFTNSSNKTTGAAVTLTLANWNMRVAAL